MGRNGAGKTTLLKSLIRNATGFIGRCRPPVSTSMPAIVGWGHEVAVGYFPQDFTTRFDQSKGMTAIAVAARQFDPQAPQEELRGPLGQMLFSGEDALKPTRRSPAVSAARLIFCRLMLQKPNFLVLDEPTNNLDLESINALNIALQKYEGTRPAGDARPRRARRSRHAHLAFQQRQNRGFQGHLRGLSIDRSAQGGLASVLLCGKEPRARDSSRTTPLPIQQTGQPSAESLVQKRYHSAQKGTRSWQTIWPTKSLFHNLEKSR